MFKSSNIVDSFTNYLKLEKRFLIDILSVLEGLRPYGLLHIPIELEPALINFLTSLDLEIFDTRYLSQKNDLNSRDAVLSDANNFLQPNYVEIWFTKLTNTSRPSSKELFLKTGLYLGYPPCCVEAWEKTNEQNNFYHQYLYKDNNRHWQINRIATAFQDKLIIPDFFPCSLGCNHALDFADANFLVAQKYFDKQWVDDAKKSLQAILLFYNSELYFFVDWTVNEHELNLDLTTCKKTPINTIANFSEFKTEHSETLHILKYDHIQNFTKVNLLKNNKVLINNANFIYK